MKRFFAIIGLCLLFAAPVTASNSLYISEGGGGTREISGQVNGGGSDIPQPIVDYILQLAAPQFGVSVRWLTVQYSRGRVTITEIAQNLYSVTYGGITIQILIESGSNYFEAIPALRN